MFIADAGIALWIVGLLLIGALGFFLVLATMLCRFIAWIFRMITGISTRRKPPAPPRIPARRHTLCPHPGCGHTNSPTALYCARCGRPLHRAYDVDAYG